VKYFPGTDRFVPDDYVNIVDEGGGVFRMTDRFRGEWWDGDRDTRNKDRQRAEVKGLGPHQHHGETFEYATTWRLNADFHGTAGFCHLFQVKAINGDAGAPLVTLSIHGDAAAVEANPAGPKIVAREFRWRPGTWQTVRIRLKPSPNADGELLVSVDGDPFTGVRGVAIARPDATEYRPKWGLYRRAAERAAMADDYVEHQAITAQQVGAPPIDNAPLEFEARRRAAGASFADALAHLAAMPPSAARDFALGSTAVAWAEREPAAAMAWAEKSAPPAERLDAVNRVFARWADRDLPAARAWLHSHAPAAELDPLVWLFVTDTTYRYVNREVARDALPLIRDPRWRAQAEAHVRAIWAREDRGNP